MFRKRIVVAPESLPDDLEMAELGSNAPRFQNPAKQPGRRDPCVAGTNCNENRRPASPLAIRPSPLFSGQGADQDV